MNRQKITKVHQLSLTRNRKQKCFAKFCEAIAKCFSFLFIISIYKTFLKGTKTLKTLHGHFYLHEILTTNLDRKTLFTDRIPLLSIRSIRTDRHMAYTDSYGAGVLDNPRHLSNLNKENTLDNFYYELKCMKCIRVCSRSSLNFFLVFFNPFNRLLILL